MYYGIETIQRERDYDIDIIISITECVLLTSKIDDMYEMCSFITNENVDRKNIGIMIPKVKKILLEQHPELSDTRADSELAQYKEGYIEYIVNYYRKKFGNKLNVKSIKKGYYKVLKNTRN